MNVPRQLTLELLTAILAVFMGLTPENDTYRFIINIIATKKLPVLPEHKTDIRVTCNASLLAFKFKFWEGESQANEHSSRLLKH